MDRLVRARVLLVEAVALGVTIDDLVAVSSDTPRSLSAVPTVAEYVETVTASFSKGLPPRTSRTGVSPSTVLVSA